LIQIKQLWPLAEKSKRIESFRLVAGRRKRDRESRARFRNVGFPGSREIIFLKKELMAAKVDTK
jgi:hypothetical protein